MIIERIKTYAKRFLMKVSYLINGVENKAVFESFSGQSYSDNPRVISELLHTLSPETEIVWLFKNPEEKRNIVPSYVRVEKRCTKNMIREYSTAKIWVNNFCVQEFMCKGKKQVYVQTWHGDRPFKKVIYESKKLNFRKNEVRENKICDLCVAGSEIGAEVYRKAFLYKGRILNIGTPRADILVNGDRDREKYIREKLGISQDSKILLYAPTFRDNKGLNSNQKIDVLNFGKLIKELQSKDNSSWYCLIRVHPSLNIKDINLDDSKIINVSNYEDMADLMLVSDMLITDYSSSAGDFILRNKPVILYQYDLSEYEKEDRELHFKMEETPFWSVQTEEDLIDLIKQINDNMVEENCRAIKEFYKTNETGKSAYEVCRFLLDKIS